jgi:hypothetical protein
MIWGENSARHPKSQIESQTLTKPCTYKDGLIELTAKYDGSYLN